MQQQPSFSQIGIIGAGEIGTALGQALTRAQTQVLYYDKDPARTTTASLEDLVRTCQVLLLCVPSWAVVEICKQIHKVAHPAEPRLVVSLSKGVGEGFITMDQVLEQHLPKHYQIGLMYGSLVAGEIMQQRPASAVLGLSDNTYFEPLRNQFKAAGIRIEATGDVRGIALCSVLKNVYAIAFGICDGLRLGLNAKTRIAVIALAEMKRLTSELGGDARTAEGIAGLGDLLSSGFGNDSFNYRIGKSLAEGIVDAHVKSEGIVALGELGNKVKMANYLLADTVSQITFHYAKPQKLVDLLS